MAKRTQCNLCGKIFDVYDEQHDFSLVRRLGYGSVYDGNEIELDICCDCMDKLLDMCKVSPFVNEE